MARDGFTPNGSHHARSIGVQYVILLFRQVGGTRAPITCGLWHFHTCKYIAAQGGCSCSFHCSLQHSQAQRNMRAFNHTHVHELLACAWHGWYDKRGSYFCPTCQLSFHVAQSEHALFFYPQPLPSRLLSADDAKPSPYRALAGHIIG